LMRGGIFIHMDPPVSLLGSKVCEPPKQREADPVPNSASPPPPSGEARFRGHSHGLRLVAGACISFETMDHSPPQPPAIPEGRNLTPRLSAIDTDLQQTPAALSMISTSERRWMNQRVFSSKMARWC